MSFKRTNFSGVYYTLETTKLNNMVIPMHSVIVIRSEDIFVFSDFPKAYKGTNPSLYAKVWDGDFCAWTDADVRNGISRIAYDAWVKGGCKKVTTKDMVTCSPKMRTVKMANFV